MRKEGMEEDRTDDCVRIEFGWGAGVELGRRRRCSHLPGMGGATLPRLGSRVRIPSPAPKSLRDFKRLRAVLRGRFLLPRPRRESRGSRGEAAESEK